MGSTATRFLPARFACTSGGARARPSSTTAPTSQMHAPIPSTRRFRWVLASSNRRRERRSSMRSLTARPIDGGRTSCAEASRSAQGPPTPRLAPSGQSTFSSARGTSCDKVRRGSAIRPRIRTSPRTPSAFPRSCSSGGSSPRAIDSVLRSVLTGPFETSSRPAVLSAARDRRPLSASPTGFSPSPNFRAPKATTGTSQLGR